MALSQAQLLKHKARKTKARAEKAKSIQKESQSRYIAKWPIVSAYAPCISQNDHTLQYALIVRQRPDGQYAAGMFLIDILCLGVKDCFIKIIPPYQLANFLKRIEEVMTIDAVEPSYVATFVHKAVDYAKRFGLEPGGDFQVVKEFLEGIDLDPSLTFVFGMDGKPVYVTGSNDSQEFSNKILAKLNATVGQGNYEFIVSVE